jgi:hypothetical protein
LTSKTLENLAGDAAFRLCRRVRLAFLKDTDLTTVFWEVSQMSFLVTAPESMADAAADLANIGTTISTANHAAWAPTSAELAAGADGVSTAVAALFGTHALDYQTLSAEVTSFHEQFVARLRGGAEQYRATEATNAAPLQTWDRALAGLGGSGGATAAPFGRGAGAIRLLGDDGNGGSGGTSGAGRRAAVTGS